MSELMTQEEIDAMLNGTPTDTGSEDTDQPAAEESVQESGPEFDQAEIETVEAEPEVEAETVLPETDVVENSHAEYDPNLAAPLTHNKPEAVPGCLEPMETDALGEIGNICMGAAATALYTILGRKVSITTPLVECTTAEFLAEEYDIPFVIVDVEYTEGVIGNNLLILRIDDVKKITDIMMGGEGVISEEDLSELHLSAISEAMNQMMGGMSTSMADMLNRIVNISPPKTMVVELNGKEIRELINSQSEALVKIGFKMEIEGIIDSGIMQLMPLSFAQELVGTVMGNFSEEASEPVASAPAPESAPPPAPEPAPAPAPVQATAAPQQSQVNTPQPQMPQQDMNSTAQQAVGQQQQGQPQQGQPGGYPPYPGWPPYPPYPGQPGGEQGANGQQHPQYPPYPPYGYPPYGAGVQQNNWPPQMPPQMQRARAQVSSEEAQIDAHPVQLDSFDPMYDNIGIPSEDGIDMIMDVPLQITVELGQSKKSIKEILDITVGSIITLDKVAGEPVDIVVNGKMIAKGEVIVIDDSYGVRITEIVSPSSRLRNIK